MSNPSVARQMDPPDSKQSSASHKLLHLPWIYCRTQTTLPSPPHDRLAARIMTGFGFKFELCRPALQDLLFEEKDFGHVFSYFEYCS